MKHFRTKRENIMLKRERLTKIMDIVNEKNIVTVNELATRIDVSDMTIRRDLDELDKSGRIIRIHGGAQSISSMILTEKSHTEKREINVAEKNEVADIASKVIRSNETIFIGPGTTLEFMCAKLDQKDLRIVTNSQQVFNVCKDNPNNYDLILIGGVYRPQSASFNGGLANQMIKKLKFDRSFVGVNGLYNDLMMTADLEEGQTLTTALNQGSKKYVLADYHKINRNDFYEFYNLYDIDALFTNSVIDHGTENHYSQFTKIVKK